MTSAALVAACLLLLQALFGGPALAGRNPTPDLDSFGNPLCAQAGAHGVIPGNQDHQHELPSCCALACAAAGLAFAVPSRAPALSAPRPEPIGPSPSLFHAPERRSSDYDPGRPRAPPAA